MRQVIARWPHPNDYAQLHRQHPPADTATWPAPVPALADIPRGHWVVLAGRPDYPTALRQTQAPPLVLFGRGNLAALTRPATVGVVGTRQMSQFGQAVVNTAVDAAAQAGATVVSGMARGCDRQAAERALEVGIPTIAVLATGPDVPYPGEHAELADRIVAGGGAIVSEQPFGTGADDAPGRRPAPLASRLVARNRIIAGLSSVLVLAEASGGSGSMATVWSALGMGRPVVVALPKPSGSSLPGAVAPLALARPLPRSAESLVKMGAPMRVADAWAGRSPLASAAATDRDELALILRTYLMLAAA